MSELPFDEEENEREKQCRVLNEAYKDLRDYHKAMGSADSKLDNSARQVHLEMVILLSQMMASLDYSLLVRPTKAELTAHKGQNIFKRITGGRFIKI